MKKTSLVYLLAIMTLFSAVSFAQSEPRFELGAGYTYVRANAPPSNCGCFSMNGGDASFAYLASHGVSLVADLNATRAGNINGQSADLTLFSYTFGSRYTWRLHRLQPFGEVLMGGAHAGGALVSANSFAMNLGGGADFRLSPHVSLRPLEATYFLTTFANGVNDHQNNLPLDTGVVFRFGNR